MQAISTAGGSSSVLRWTGPGAFLIDALNATGSFSFRTGATPTNALTISSAQLVALPAIPTSAAADKDSHVFPIVTSLAVWRMLIVAPN